MLSVGDIKGDMELSESVEILAGDIKGDMELSESVEILAGDIMGDTELSESVAWAPVDASHTRTEPSYALETMRVPLVEKATDVRAFI